MLWSSFFSPPYANFIQSSALSEVPSVERRSASELQDILDSLIGPAGFVLSGNLPDVLLAYETDHDVTIVDPSEYDGLRTLCTQHADLELGPKELFSFLSMIPKPIRTVSPMPAPSLPHSASLPPTSFRAAQSTPSQPIRPNRRQSDRIRSPSDSSESESDEDTTARSTQPKTTQPKSAPFPPSGIPVPVGHRPFPPVRQKTLSDSSRLDSPLAARFRNGTGPPSAFGGAGGFARPSPANRRRRGSAGGTHAADTNGMTSPNFGAARPFGRSTSSSSLGMTRPLWKEKSQSQPTSPISPTHALDHTSFHLRAATPEEGRDGVDLVENHVQPARQIRDDDGEVDEVDADIVRQDLSIIGPLDPRLSRISTDSAASLRTSHDKLSALQEQNAELARKLKDSERQLAILGAENERLVEDLQDKLEESRSELSQRRKDEKEMKGKERAQAIQISGFEADIQSLQRSLENSKANHVNMQKMYNSQCDEAQRLRDLLRDRDEEIKDFEHAAQVHGANDEKFNREIKALEIAIKRLESDLSAARQAESGLEMQKQENLALKETIDRMRFELDEARSTASNSAGVSHIRSGTSGPQTLSRNLGDELNRRLQDAERVRQESEDGESVVETMVTTQRTRKIGGRAQTAHCDASGSIPVIRVAEGIREYADAATETDPIAGPSHESMSPMPPAYTAEAEPLNSKEVLDHAHPREEGHNGEGDEAYEALVEALGIRCTVQEEELQIPKAERGKRGARVIPNSSFTDRRNFYSKPGIVNYIYSNTPESLHDQVGKLATWSVVVFAVGIIAGSHLFGAPSGLHPRDYHLFSQMNSLANAAGAGEGFLPIGNRGFVGVVSAGAGMIAGRVPT